MGYFSDARSSPLYFRSNAFSEANSKLTKKYNLQRNQEEISFHFAMYYNWERERGWEAVVIKLLLEIFSLVHRIYDETNHTNFKNNSRRQSPGMTEVLF